MSYYPHEQRAIAITHELRELRRELEHLPKAGAGVMSALLSIADELPEWERALRRWAREYDAALFAHFDDARAEDAEDV